MRERREMEAKKMSDVHCRMVLSVTKSSQKWQPESKYLVDLQVRVCPIGNVGVVDARAANVFAAWALEDAKV